MHTYGEINFFITFTELKIITIEKHHVLYVCMYFESQCITWNIYFFHDINFIKTVIM